jgi:hypothetical protein
MQVAARVSNSGSGRQQTAVRSELRPEDPSHKTLSLRWQYSVHPSLRPTVFVPGPVVAVRKV